MGLVPILNLLEEALQHQVQEKTAQEIDNLLQLQQDQTLQDLQILCKEVVQV